MASFGSVPALGMGWYYPAGPGDYFYYKADSIYRAMLRLGFQIGGRILFEAADFDDAGIRITSSHHSKDLLNFEFTASAIAVSSAFFLIGENTIACSVAIKNRGTDLLEAGLVAVQRLELGDAEWWGRDGISGQYEEAGQHSVLRCFAAGPVFVLKSNQKPSAHFISAEDAALKVWMAGNKADLPAATTYFPLPLNSALGFRASLAPGATWTGDLVLSRADNDRFSRREAEASIAHIATAQAAKIADDGKFWSRAPQLEGDLPEHWKNAWVYDLETLRMMVRRPVGLYKHPGTRCKSKRHGMCWQRLPLTCGRSVMLIPKPQRLSCWANSRTPWQPNVPCMRRRCDEHGGGGWKRVRDFHPVVLSVLLH